MLSRRERESLKEIERRLCDEAPELARCFTQEMTRPPRLWLHQVTLLLAILALVMSIVLDSEGLAFLAALITGAVVLDRRLRVQAD